jgi:hypothetical protein
MEGAVQNTVKIGQWNNESNTLGVSESHFFAMVIIVAVSAVSYALRSKKEFQYRACNSTVKVCSL